MYIGSGEGGVCMYLPNGYHSSENSTGIPVSRDWDHLAERVWFIYMTGSLNGGSGLAEPLTASATFIRGSEDVHAYHGPEAETAEGSTLRATSRER